MADGTAAAERVLRISITELFHAAVVTPEPSGDGWALDIGSEALHIVQDRLVKLDPTGEDGLRIRGAVGAMHAVLAVMDRQAGIASEPTSVVDLDT